MEETVHDLTMKIRQRKKSMTATSKYEVGGYYDFITRRDNDMYTLLYTNIYEIS